MLDALFRNARMEDSSMSLFMRNKRKILDNLVNTITGDSRLMSMTKTQDTRVLRSFLAQILMAGADSDINTKTLEIFMNMARLIFSPENGQVAFETILHHIKRQNYKMSSNSFSVLSSSLEKTYTKRVLSSEWAWLVQ